MVLSAWSGLRQPNPGAGPGSSQVLGQVRSWVRSGPGSGQVLGQVWSWVRSGPGSGQVLGQVRSFWVLRSCCSTCCWDQSWTPGWWVVLVTRGESRTSEVQYAGFVISSSSKHFEEKETAERGPDVNAQCCWHLPSSVRGSNPNHRMKTWTLLSSIYLKSTWCCSFLSFFFFLLKYDLLWIQKRLYFTGIIFNRDIWQLVVKH